METTDGRRGLLINRDGLRRGLAVKEPKKTIPFHSLYHEGDRKGCGRTPGVTANLPHRRRTYNPHKEGKRSRQLKRDIEGGTKPPRVKAWKRAGRKRASCGRHERWRFVTPQSLTASHACSSSIGLDPKPS
ncbi:hypothetical protein THAOC_13523 [Thalassiosira oceanica]|uniref:Uncharacterized protein n=1 Tax=Thalassiosira oceanica TaxID=159749 RepID=K0SKW9_THAOC|nr:hypothetical protein THAOC_13523 [Thalassiosira oceanica]|eukprot:EJK65599.1 hypothetical protein THAOC_13523 [Thalassiosira oceanica]